MPVRRDPRTKRWFFRATVKHPDGTRRRIFGTPGVPGPYQDLAASKVGAQEAERRAIAEVTHGKPARAAAPITKEVQTIREYAATFLGSYVPTLTKPSARRAVEQILAAHVLPAFGDLVLDAIRQEHVDAFVGAAKRRGLAVKSINNRLSVLSSLLRYAIANGVIAPPRVRLRCKVPGKTGEVRAVPMTDVERVLAVATDERHRAAVLLATEAGLRTGEIRGLQWTDIRDGQLTVRRALDKDTGEAVAPKHDKVRTVPLSPRLASALDSMRRRGLWVVSRLDGGALGYDGLLEVIGALYDRAEVPRPPMPIHCLRHTFGTVMAGQGVPLPVLQELMGHEDIATTRKYVDVSEEQKRAAIAAVWQPRGSGDVRAEAKPRKK